MVSQKDNIDSFVFAALLLATLSFWAAGCTFSSTEPEAVDTQRSLRRELLAEERSRTSNGRIPASSTRDYQFLLGELALKEERFDEAVKFYESAAKDEPGSAPMLRKRLAQLYLRDGQLKEALRQIDFALQEGEETDLLQLRAGILAALKRPTDAIQSYLRIVELTNGQSEEPFVFIASLYAQQNDLGSARDTLHQLIESKPQSFFGHYYLAKVYVASSDFEKAEEHYKKALALSPDTEAIELELARVYAYQDKLSEARELSERIVQRNPGNAKAHELLAELLLGEDRVEDALREYEALKSLEEDPSDTRFRIGVIKLQRRDLVGAEIEFRLVLAEHPEHTPSRYYLASTYAAMRNIDEAVEEIKKIPAGERFFVEGRMLGAFLLRQAERNKDAVEMLKPLTEETPEDVKVLSFYAALHRESDSLPQAVKITERIIELEPEQDQHYFNLGVYLDELGKRAEAFDAMRKAIELNPLNANALNYLGYSLAEEGRDLEQAEELIQRAIALEENNGYYIDSLGWVYFQMERYEEAYRELARAAELVPDDAVILEHLGMVQLKLGKKAQAMETFNKALSHAPESDDKEVGKRITKELEKLGAKQ